MGRKPKEAKTKETVSKTKETVSETQESVSKPPRKIRNENASPRGQGFAPGGLRISDDIEPGMNNKYVLFNLSLSKMPRVDLNDPVALQERVDMYMNATAERDIKPTLAGLALALGYNRRVMYDVRHHIVGPQRAPNLCQESWDIIDRTYAILETLWEDYMANGKINPVSGIFLGKNNFGYVDKVEHVVTPSMNSAEDYDVDDIRRRYIDSSATVKDSDD